MTTCNDQQVPKPATGKTPVRNARIPDEVWLPALAKAEMEGRNASEAMTEALRKYASEPPAAAYAFTFANWPEARQWTDGHSGAVAELAGEVGAAISGVSPEWLAVAAWLASTRHPADPVQQRRVLAGHIIGRALDMPADSAWRARYRDTRHLLDVIQVILDEHLPLGES